MKNKSISELAKMYFEAPKNERGFVTAYANLKFGKEAWRDALSNCAAQPCVEPTGANSAAPKP